MKRGQNSYEGGPPGGPMKRPRGDKFEARVLVPSKVAGSIIGKGGSNIQKLRTDNQANVRIPDCPGPERIMTVLADDPDSAINVLRQSLPYMADADSRGGGMANEDGTLEIRLLIHQSIVGGIIGRAGFKIKEIREASGANIKVYQNCAPQSTDRCVAINGLQEKIVKAAAEVFQVVANTEIKGMDEPYDPINYDAYYASEYGGYGGEDMGFSGGPGGPRAGGSGGAGGRGGFRGGSSNGGGRQMGYGGADGQFGNFRGRGGGSGYAGQYGGGPPGRGGFGRGGFGGRGGGFGGGGDFGGGDFGQSRQGGFSGGPNFGGSGMMPDDSGLDSGGEQESTQVTIPKDMAGAIIGPGGSRIRKIRNDSKATITIDEPVQGSNERIITITGTERQIQTAQYLLQQSVRENAPASLLAGAGGQGQGGGAYSGGY